MPAATKKEKIKVVCRFRPLNADEASDPSPAPFFVQDGPPAAPKIVEADMQGKKGRCFDKYDVVCSSDWSQERVFEATCASFVKEALDGYNTCLVAYGQSGGGKTYSMVGPDADPTHEDCGVIPRMCKALVAASAQEGSCKFSCSFYELTLASSRESVIDLLNPKGATTLPMRSKYPQIAKLTKLPANTADEMMAHLVAGQSKREVTSVLNHLDSTHLLLSHLLPSASIFNLSFNSQRTPIDCRWRR